MPAQWYQVNNAPHGFTFEPVEMQHVDHFGRCVDGVRDGLARAAKSPERVLAFTLPYWISSRK